MARLRDRFRLGLVIIAWALCATLLPAGAVACRGARETTRAAAQATSQQAKAPASRPQRPPEEPPSPELDQFARRFGPAKYSENGEEWLARDFFRDRRGGFFVDIGASDYQKNSNTYFLDERLGWSGIAVDALAQFAPDYEKFRPRTRFFAFFVSDRSDAQATLYLHERNTLVSSLDKSFTEQWGANPKAVQVPTITLNDLLQSQHVQRIDFMSIDIELAEPKALAGFDIARFRPALVCVEAHAQVRQAILDYFAEHGYVVVGRYLRADPKNLWFVPLKGARTGNRPG